MERAGIVGPGRVGTALALALAGVQDVRGACGGGAPSRQHFSELTRLPAIASCPDLVRGADWIYLTVPDDHVADVCRTLAQEGALHAGQVVCHTSGVLDARALASARPLGAQLLSMHPMRAIARLQVGQEAFLRMRSALSKGTRVRRRVRRRSPKRWE